MSLATIWRRRVSYDIEPRRRQRRLNQTELKQFIEQLQETTPGIGIRMVEGYLRSAKLYSTRDEIAETLRAMDPIGSILRWNEQIPRVPYSVPG